jgi:hypothetical protein
MLAENGSVPALKTIMCTYVSVREWIWKSILPSQPHELAGAAAPFVACLLVKQHRKLQPSVHFHGAYFVFPLFKIARKDARL